jgi:cytochrome c oxidase assembly protein subunit 15
MYSNEKKINKLFFYWLNISLILVFFIIIVGGLTRLTNSGLSITEWELFKGLLPPLNIDSWEYYFNQYKQIPQYKILYPSMSLEEFKIIFFWEYFHRIIARFIGLFFLIPLIYFHITKKIEKKYIKLSYVIAILILVQGVIGWFMVKSGLINDVTVSHYRLSIHLSFAVIIISSIFWLIINKKSNTMVKFFKFSKKIFLFLYLFYLFFFK